MALLQRGLILTVVVLAGALVAPALAADPVVIRVGTVAPEGTPWERHVNVIRKRLKKESNNRVQMKVYLGGQKGDERSLVRQAKSGRLECIGVSTASLATEVPELQVLELPFLFESSEEADFVLDNYLYKPVQEIVQKYGFVLYQWAENGWQNMGTKKGFTKTPESLKGQKMRAQEAPLHIATWRAFGAAPVEMAVSEVLPALQTGLVDGFAQTPLFTFAAGWHQGIKNYTVTKHIYQPAAIVYSKKFFDGQPKDVQAVLMSNVEDITKSGREGVRRIEPGLMQNFVNYGIEVYELTPAEREAFVKASHKVHAEYLKTAPAGAKRLMKAIQDGKAAFKKQKTN